ncbi:MAG: TVP38/TMEM64 family protein [Ardenticatenaceae bacterium]
MFNNKTRASAKVAETQQPITDTSFIRRHRSKLMALLFWLAVVGSYWWVANQYNLPPETIVKELADWFVSSIFGPLLFILFFALQPLVLFPSALMALMGGCLYGATQGILITIIGANAAGCTSYLVGRYFGQGMLESEGESDGLMHRYADYIRTNSFEAILIMHLLFLPYDLVNFMAGFLRVNWKSFILATALGSLPGTLTLVLFGASFEGKVMSGAPEINLSTLIFSGLMMLVSLALSQILKQRQKHLDKTIVNTI